jgi:hypothetical protein
MCQRFSCIALTIGEFEILWTPPISERHSHQDVIRLAGLSDDHSARFVRLECRPPFVEVTLDESSAREWWNENRHAIEQRVIALAKWQDPLFADYKAKRAPLDADYEVRCAPSPVPYTRCVIGFAT